MGLDILLGLQWGDEGKGKIVDVLCPQYDLVARFQGGPNAGHTLEFNHKKYVLNTIPSGIFNDRSSNLIGNGVVIDPAIFKKELDNLVQNGFDPYKPGKLLISKKAHLIIPTHALLDADKEMEMGTQKIGSTLKGIGPVYTDKVARNGLRVGDLTDPNFKERYQHLKNKHLDLIKNKDLLETLEERESKFFEGARAMLRLELVDGEYLINQFLKQGKNVLAEGAQGSMLDIDFGSYPYVTSSNTTSAGACTGLGIAPQSINKVFGIFKAYCTRVGSGPFPTELENETGELLRKIGNEFGATTGRPRRCGWIDLPALKYAIMLSGVNSLVMTKADVLSGFTHIQVCTHYEYEGKIQDQIPYDLCRKDLKPIFIEMEGWKEDLTGLIYKKDIPEKLMAYIQFLEKELEVPIQYLSVGPDRVQTLELK